MNAIWCHFLAEILREDFHRLVVHRLVGRVLNGGKKVHQIVFHGRNGIDVKIPSGTSTLIGWLNVFWWPLEARDLILRFDWSGHKPENCLSDNNLEDFFSFYFAPLLGLEWSLCLGHWRQLLGLTQWFARTVHLSRSSHLNGRNNGRAVDGQLRSLIGWDNTGHSNSFLRLKFDQRDCGCLPCGSERWLNRIKSIFNHFTVLSSNELKFFYVSSCGSMEFPAENVKFE